MAKESLIKNSIDKRLEEERHVIPKERKKRRTFNLQLIIILSIIIGLLLSVLRLIPYFVN